MKTSKIMKAIVLATFVVLLVTSVVVAQGGGPGDVVAMNVSSSSITWVPLGGEATSMTLTITGPDGYYFREDFGGRAAISSRGLADGSYLYEVTLSSGASPDQSSDSADRGLVFFPIQNRTQAGGFTVSGGRFVSGGSEDVADQVVADDQIVQGSLCVGFDCVNGEAFGFDTIRLKENNLRIKFEDTSIGTFPTNDWQIIANDSASGGVNFLAIEDTTGAKVPFKVVAGAATNSIFVDSIGRVGLRTGTPILDLHMATGNTPGIRLEQNGTGGFTPQTWDVAGNEANFFVRDVTGGSRLPFRIRPGAPTSSIDISADGDVGFGTASPDFNLHVERAGVNPKIAAVRTDAGVDGAIIKLQSNATKGFVGTENNFALGFLVNNDEKMFVSAAGNLTVDGSVTATAFNPSSDRHIKENFARINRSSVLDRLSRIPISTWNFIGDDGALHMGPMAQDFYAAFGLGIDDKHISTVDADGVAFAAIQELNSRNQALTSENAALRGQVKDLANRVSSLEAGGVPFASFLTWFLVATNLTLIAWTVLSARRSVAAKNALRNK